MHCVILKTKRNSPVDSWLREREKYDWEGGTAAGESNSYYEIPQNELAWLVQTLFEVVQREVEFTLSWHKPV